MLSEILRAVESIQYDDLPNDVRSTVTDAITDAIGVGIAGSIEPACDSLVAATADYPGNHALIGRHGVRRDRASAACFNGTAIHALDFDDTNHPAYSHPSSHLVATILAHPAASGREALRAYALGLEVEARLGRSMNMSHYLHGWHATGTFGTIASTVAAIVLSGCSEAAAVSALGIAASMASGVRANFGTMTKPLHAGLAASNGIRAVEFASCGLTASASAVDGKFGFFDVLGDGTEAAQHECWGTLGEDWETISPFGLALKPYPSCGATHPAIESALRIFRRNTGRDVKTIDQIRVDTPAYSREILVYDRPQSGLEGKFSMEYCVASALTRGAITLDSFTDTAVQDPSIQSVLPSITVSESAEVAGDSEFATRVSVSWSDGHSDTEFVPLAPGKRARWFTPAEVEDKFMMCASRAIDQSSADKIFGACRGIADLGSINELTEQF
ncbi:MmgE/PrpD family protein [Rhodococcus opacus]|uniref:MmgE/PrpD family protein n=1 Tax=Rhodococcus opacus TaxID=37919 RepID=A0ABT4NTE1_RHOOP|nr:MmgE/PrpD family protein [Rhodococcus opacus]MCZ4590456.1 MmgE/PrpD family protein [Rhodococcus opacus]MDV7087593.1 MmgE/PrpD family protein [Rhodococcus opacus]